jgi:hypothetical protein
MLANTTRHILIMDDTFFPDGHIVGGSAEVQAEHSAATDGPTVAWSEAVRNGAVRHDHSFIERYCDCFEFTDTVDENGLAEWRNCASSEDDEARLMEEGWGEWDSGVSVGSYTTA